MRKYPAAPHPFVLCPPLEDDRAYEPGEELVFELNLIGRAVDYLPYFVYTFEELGRMGLGQGRGKFSVEEIRLASPGFRTKARGRKEDLLYTNREKTLRKPKIQACHPAVEGYPPPPDSEGLNLIFLTPARLKYEGNLSPDLPFHVLFRSLLRRISLLSYFHCGQELDVDFRGLIRKAEGVCTEKSNLRWFDWERYSTRQETKMKLGGLVGRIAFAGEFDLFWPYLLLGETVHVGKGSSFGLGKYEILKNG